MRKVSTGKKTGVLAAAALTLSLVLAASGCGPSTPSTTSSTASAATSTASGSASTESVDMTIPTGPVTLNVYHWTAASNVQPIIDEFQKEYPNVTVSYHQLTTSDHQYSNVVLASGSPVDVMAQGTIDDTRMRVENNIYTNLNPYLQADNIDFTATFGKDVAGMETFNGNVYCIPYCVNIRGLLYNKDMFDAAGVAYPTANWTWDDLRAAALKLTSGSDANKVYGIIPNYDDNAGMDWGLLAQEALGANWMYSSDGKSSNFTDPAVLKSLQYWYDMEMTDKSAWPVSDYAALKIDSNPFVQFYTGKAAMLINPEYAIKYSSQSTYNFTGFNYAVAPIPKLNASDPQTNIYYVTDWGIPVSSTQKVLAWKFIKLGSIDRPDLFAGAKGQLPAPQMSSLSSDMQTTMKNLCFNFPKFDMQSGLDTFINNPATYVYDTSTFTTAKTQINQFVMNEVINCLEGNESPQDACQSMKVNCDSLIQQALSGQ